MIKLGSKCRLKGKPIKGVSFKVILINNQNIAKVLNSVSKLSYDIHINKLELI